MPKAITYPTDSRLYLKSTIAIARIAKFHGIVLRQTYKKLAPRALRMRNRYAHARQMKRAQKEEKKLRNYFGRILRDFERKSEQLALSKDTQHLLNTIRRILTQERGDSKKVYSVHEPEVECISKGKMHKKYEFGCKVSLVLTHKEGLALDVNTFHGASYDGHTLMHALRNAEANSHTEIEDSYVDKGYRGHGIVGKRIFISGQKQGVTRRIKKEMKRRESIEPHIGHMKSEGKLGKNHLRGVCGDCFNSILCGVGHNLRLIRNWLDKQRRLACEEFRIIQLQKHVPKCFLLL